MTPRGRGPYARGLASSLLNFSLLCALLGATACGDDVAAESGSSESGSSDSEPTGGLACETPCGEQAHCDPGDGRCYCDVGSFGDPNAACSEHGDMCFDAAERVGQRVCVHELHDLAVWDSLSIGTSARAGWRKIGKYLAPAIPEAPLPVVFNDATRYRLHYCMLKQGFQPLFPGFAYPDYNAFVYYRDSRKMFAGNIVELTGDDLAVPFGFTVETPDAAAELISEAEAYSIYRQIQDRFHLGDVGYIPSGAAQEAAAMAWKDPRVAVVLGGEESVTFEAYASGVAYGRVRRYTSEQVSTATGSFGWQDILVLESAPSDLRGVMAGVVTGARQDLLSHLNVLAAQRGTPNAFIADPLAAFAPYDGQLVRLSVSEKLYSILPASLAEAEAFWSEHRPSVPIDNLPDPAFLDLRSVDAIPTATAEDRGLAIGRYGGKVKGLATLSQILDPAYQTPGMGISTAHYLKFMQDNSWELVLAGKKQTLSFADTITAWLADPDFRSDTGVRRAWLAALSAAMVQRGKVDPALLAELRTRIGDVFGDPDTMVRLRSSSNAEDALEFNGAGLYTSVSACGGDPDGSSGGDSACDPGKSRRPLDEGLKIVWASLWDFGAFEEREYFQIDHSDIAMGVLVSTQYEDEQANGVAFTGNPTVKGDPRYTINVQLGEVDVVDAPAGTIAELDLLTMKDGAVAEIERAAASTLVEPGAYVLSDDQLGEIGEVLADIVAAYPVEVGDHEPSEVLLDLEFKITGEGKLVFKQIRTFLRNALDPLLPTCLDP